jgi:branched-chain amino acid transport system substrate-binding protein
MQDDDTRSDKVSRREFLKMAGVAGAAIGVGAGLGGLVAACGDEEATTTTAGATSTTAAPATTTTTAAASTTTVSAGPVAGREVRIGVVTPATGPLASFSTTVKWSVERVNEFAKDGLVFGDGQNHPLKLITVDTQSDAQRAAAVTGDLINNDKVDMVISAGSPETVVPSADQCEAAGVPSLASNVPWQAFHFGRGGTPDSSFKWTYAMALGLEQIVGGYIDMWSQLETNRVLGVIWPNNADGQSWSDATTGAPPMMEGAGYKLIFPSLYPPGSDDFTTQIAQYRKGGAELMAGAIPPPDFNTFWNQCAQQGFKPKAMTIGLALLFPETATALGDIVVGLTSELLWHPSWPFKSSLTGETCQQLADDYEARTGQQWSAAIPQYARLEWAIDALKRTKNLDDKNEIVANVASTKMETCWGPVDFTAPVQMGTDHPTPNIVRTLTAGGQWIKGTKHKYEIIPVSNAFAAGTQVVAKVQPITYK